MKTEDAMAAWRLAPGADVQRGYLDVQPQVGGEVVLPIEAAGESVFEFADSHTTVADLHFVADDEATAAFWLEHRSASDSQIGYRLGVGRSWVDNSGPVLSWSHSDDQGGYREGVVGPYEPRLHKWFRLRDDQGAVYWELSADGRAWRAFHSAPLHGDGKHSVRLRFAHEAEGETAWIARVGGFGSIPTLRAAARELGPLKATAPYVPFRVDVITRA